MEGLNNKTSSERIIRSCYNYNQKNSVVRNIYFPEIDQNLKIMDWITMGIGVPLTVIVIVAVFLQVKKDQCAPVFIINLLFSDLIQFSGRITYNLQCHDIGYALMEFGLIASVGFVVFVSLERYLVIAKPLWYRFRRNIKTYVVVCVVVWTIPLLILISPFLTTDPNVGYIIFKLIFPSLYLLPFPLLIFFLVGTIKALSGALSVPAEVKRRIIAIQVVVLLIYTLLFLPMISYLLSNEFKVILYLLFLVCLFLSPLADTTLYLLSRKSFLDKFLASLCSCKASDNQEMSRNDNESTTAPHAETI